MLRLQRLLASVALTFLLLHCRAVFELPKGVQLTCGPDTTCPGGLVCRESIGRCVKPDASGAEPPALSGKATVTPSAGNAGTVFTLSFDVTKALNSPPKVLAESRDQQFAFVADDAAST